MVRTRRSSHEVTRRAGGPTTGGPTTGGQAAAGRPASPAGGPPAGQMTGQVAGHHGDRTARPGGPRGGGMPRPRPIRSRLARILALPLVAVVVLLSVVMVQNLDEYRLASRTTDAVELTLAVQNLAQELQQERGLTSGLLGGNVSFRDEMEPARRRVDTQRATVGRLAARDIPNAAGVRAALHRLDDLSSVRLQVDTGKAPRATTFQYFSDGIARLTGYDPGLDGVPDQRLRHALAALEALGEFKEQTAQERAFLNGVYSAGGFREGEYVQFAAMNGAQQAALGQYRRHATTGQRALLDEVLDTGAASEAAYFEQLAQRSADGRLLQINPQSWWSALTTVLEGVRDAQRSVGTDIQGRAGELRRDATRNLIVLLLMALLCVSGAFVLVISATRSIAGPLMALASEADSVASQRLPTAVDAVQSGRQEDAAPPPAVRVPVRSSAEIRSVAVALERVQATAYALAGDQARLRRNTTDSLANLGRRNQNLLRRQIGFITQLEREETDPSVLANLFELDHLATRMRRNAESLLVLVGEQTPRRWTAPLPVADVIRAAISEVEEYRRVTLRRIDDGYVIGTAVSNLSHMVAELVENGLSFSPPDMDVEIQGRMLGNRYLIAITDQGVGMSPDDLDKANARLRGEENFLLSPTRFLGHYVVGRLAREMSVDVQIAPSPVIGVTARVLLPESMLSRPGELTQGEAAPSGRAAAGNGRAPAPVPPVEVETVDAEMVDDAGGIVSPTVASPLVVPAAGPRPGAPSPVPPPPTPPPSVLIVPPPGAPTGGAHAANGYAAAGQAPPGALEWWGRPAPGDEPGFAAAPAFDAPPPAHAAPSDDEAARTRNGLPKRVPRARGTRSEPARSGAADRPASPGPADRPAATDRPADRQATTDRSATDLRRRLTSLRAGVQRGESERATVPGENRAATGGRWTDQEERKP